MEFKTDKFKIMTINKELGLKQEKVQAVKAKEDLVKDIKSESKKWKSIDKDFSLVYHLNKSTKDELLSIAKNLNINKVSRLKKDDLINKIVELYKDRINEIIENIDSEKLNYLIDLATKKEGYEDNINEIDIHSVYYFRERAILFTGKINEKYVVVMPKEVQELIISKNTKVNSDTKTIIKPRKIGRNELCPCGSGKKYKRCCGSRI